MSGDVEWQQDHDQQMSQEAQDIADDMTFKEPGGACVTCKEPRERLSDQGGCMRCFYKRVYPYELNTKQSTGSAQE